MKVNKSQGLHTTIDEHVKVGITTSDELIISTIRARKNSHSWINEKNINIQAYRITQFSKWFKLVQSFAHTWEIENAIGVPVLSANIQRKEENQEIK